MQQQFTCIIASFQVDCKVYVISSRQHATVTPQDILHIIHSYTVSILQLGLYSPYTMSRLASGVGVLQYLLSMVVTAGGRAIL